MTSDLAFEFDDVFDEDYLYFYQETLTAERTAKEVEAIWSLLALQTGHSVLDLGCGHGRIANALAKRGARVTGLDRASLFIEKARDHAAAMGVDVDYVVGDMREITWDRTFDGVVLWFTTFGYFSDDENERVLELAVRALKPGGWLVIEQANRNVLLRDRVPLTSVVRRGDDLLIDLVDYDGLADRSKTERIIVRNGTVRSMRYTVRLYSFAELARLLMALGMSSVEGLGPSGTPYTVYANRVITRAVK
jgi:SAM-dependent methyltransferase